MIIADLAFHPALELVHVGLGGNDVDQVGVVVAAVVADGAALADSWAMDAHKWLNVPYDSGLAIVRDPETLRGALAAPAAYLAMGEINFAITDFDEVIRQTPDNASAYYKRGIALGRRGDFREAVDSYTQAIRLDPKFAPSYYNRGLLYRRLGNAQQADADLAKARALDPKVESLARPLEVARR